MEYEIWKLDTWSGVGRHLICNERRDSDVDIEVETERERESGHDRITDHFPSPDKNLASS